LESWRAAGFELFSGSSVPSKAFGEYVEFHDDTPRLPAEEIKALIDEGADMVILDSRPFDEYRRMNIPGGIDTPGTELVYRVGDLAPNPDTLVVVNCAGRTRSIIGAAKFQGLKNSNVADGWRRRPYGTACPPASPDRARQWQGPLTARRMSGRAPSSNLPLPRAPEKPRPGSAPGRPRRKPPRGFLPRP
jgi:rhodanese-related sulfurtransferase